MQGWFIHKILHELEDLVRRHFLQVGALRLLRLIDLPEQYHAVAPDDVEAQRDVSELVPHNVPLECVLEHEVC